MAKIRAREGTKFNDRDARLISRFLNQKFPDGAFTAREVLDLARPRSSPIHRYFEWDDSVAAERYRLRQAGQMIQCLVVEIDDIETRKYTRPIIINGRKKAYVDVDRARNDHDLWGQVLESAMRDAFIWRERYQKLKELSLIREAISETENSLRAKGVEI